MAAFSAEKLSKFGLIAIHLVSIASFCMISCQMIGTRKYFKRVYSIFVRNPKWPHFQAKNDQNLDFETFHISCQMMCTRKDFKGMYTALGKNG